MYTYQRTIKQAVTCTGIGMHSGIEVNLTIKPAPVNHGIKFVRIDLLNQPVVAAHFNNVVDTSLATVLGSEGFIISTIEHLMATFAALGIDNVIVEIDGYELPIMDGSAQPYTQAILDVGVEKQDAPRFYFVINDPIILKEDGKSVEIYPSDSYKISCTIDFDHPLLKNQTFTVDVTENNFAVQIANARTFGFLHEYEYLKKYGFARGGSLENAVVIDKTDVLNEGGLRHTNEFVRHKILDCIGDFSLLGLPMLGHIVAHKSGHAFNHSFLKKFFEEKKSWETKTISQN